MRTELRQAVRALRCAPGFSAAAVLTLGLGIGVTTTLVNVVDILMFRSPVGVERADQLLRPYFHFQTPLGDWTGAAVSYPDFTDLRDKVPAFEQVAAYYSTPSSLGRGSEARPITVYGVTGDYFRLLGARAGQGRLLDAADDSSGRAAFNAVLSERLWRALGADAGILGTTLVVGKDKFAVVGIAPAGFTSTELRGPDLWVPMGAIGETFAPDFATQRGDYFLSILARIRPGASAAIATAQATAAIRAGRADPASANGFEDVTLAPIQEARGPEAGTGASVALWLVGVSVIVLLVACANVGNLLLHRGLARARELAVRKALGASQGRIARLLLLESLILGLLGGAVALMMAVWGGSAVRRFLLPAGAGGDFAVDARLFAVAAAASIGAGLIAGVLPAWRNAGGDLGLALKDGSGGAGYRRSWLRDGLVIAQVALSLVLVVGAGLFVRSLRNALALDIGFDVARVMVLRSDLAAAGYSATEVQRSFSAIQDAVRRDPSVESASLSLGSPFGFGFATSVKLAGGDSIPEISYQQPVDPWYRRTVGLALLQGRELTEADRSGSPKVALVSRETARRFWHGASPIGQCMRLGDDQDCTEVVGVVEEGRRRSILENPEDMLYLPLDQSADPTRGMTLLVRTRGEARRSVESVRALAQSAVPGLPYITTQAMSDIIAPQYDAWRMGATMFGLFAALALGLATIGVYSTLAYAVRGRTRELGIRLALGASDPEIVKLIARDGMRLVAIGLAAGLLFALAGGRALASLLYGVRPTDPLVFSLSAAVLAIAAVCASVLPAHRATRVDPMVVLRAE